jgi:hypothetical protein
MHASIHLIAKVGQVRKFLLSLIYIVEFFGKKHPRFGAAVPLSLLALATLGDAIQKETILLVSRHPRRQSQVGELGELESRLFCRKNLPM